MYFRILMNLLTIGALIYFPSVKIEQPILPISQFSCLQFHRHFLHGLQEKNISCLYTRCWDDVKVMEAHSNPVCKAADGWTRRADIKCYGVSFWSGFRVMRRFHLLLRFLRSVNGLLKTIVTQVGYLYRTNVTYSSHEQEGTEAVGGWNGIF
jgi:hypothetical protein